MAVLFRTDSSTENVKPKNGTDFSLEELQEMVGGTIEIIRLSNLQLMIVHDEGKILGLPVNLYATILYRMYICTDDFIAGDALLCYATEVT